MSGYDEHYALAFILGNPTPLSYVVPPPSTPYGTSRFLREDGSWDVPPGSGSSAQVRVALAQSYTTDITGGITSANTWTQILTPLTFDTTFSSSVVLMAISGNIKSELTDGTATGVAARVRIDDTGDYPFSGADAPASGTTFVNALTGAGLVVVGGLSAGSHEMTIDLWADGDLTYNCRCATRFPIESLAITILEVQVG